MSKRYTHYFDTRIEIQFDSDIEDFDEAFDEWMAQFFDSAARRKALLDGGESTKDLMRGIIHSDTIDTLDDAIDDAIPSKLHPLAVLGEAPGYGSLKGYCATTYSDLVSLLGLPHKRCSDKTTVEWAFRCNNGTIFTVYDWKQPSTPTGLYRWHIGGTDSALEAFTRHTGLSWIPMLSCP
jgi:hypothetical protein